MIIVKEKKRNTLSEDTAKVLLQDFVKIVGKKATCQAIWKSKSGLTDIAAYPPAFCRFNNGFFQLAIPQGILFVDFPVRSIMSVTKGFYADAPDGYSILIRDGSRIDLLLL
jgi:hypothetical protein